MVVYVTCAECACVLLQDQWKELYIGTAKFSNISPDERWVSHINTSCIK